MGRQRPSISGRTPVCLHVRCFQQDSPGLSPPPHTQPHLAVAAGWLGKISPVIFCPVPKCLSQLLTLFTEQRFSGLTPKRCYIQEPLEFSTVHSSQTVVILTSVLPRTTRKAVAQVPRGRETRGSPGKRGGTHWPSIAHQVSSGVLHLSKPLSGPAHPPREAHQSLEEVFINTLLGEAAYNQRKLSWSSDGISVQFWLWSMCSAVLSLLEELPWVRSAGAVRLGPLVGASQAVVKGQWGGHLFQPSWLLAESRASAPGGCLASSRLAGVALGYSVW